MDKVEETPVASRAFAFMINPPMIKIAPLPAAEKLRQEEAIERVKAAWKTYAEPANCGGQAVIYGHCFRSSFTSPFLNVASSCGERTLPKFGLGG
jgi:hypothetical protein